MKKKTSSYSVKAISKGKQNTVIHISGSYESAVRAGKAVLDSDKSVSKVEISGNGKKEAVER